LLGVGPEIDLRARTQHEQGVNIMIKFDDNYDIGNKVANGFVVRSIMFKEFTLLVRSALSKVNAGQRYDTVIQRERISAQVEFSTTDGTTYKITTDDVMRLPLKGAKKVVANISTYEGVAGSLLNDQDGINNPILYKLGTPIKISGKPDISELEFQAATYGEIEDILSGDTYIFQAIDLIEKIAKPVGNDLMVLPSWAISQITMADGVTIMEKVLPRFLE